MISFTADGNGIYDGDGTVPNGTDATLGGSLDFVASTGDEFRIASENELIYSS